MLIVLEIAIINHFKKTGSLFKIMSILFRNEKKNYMNFLLCFSSFFGEINITLRLKYKTLCHFKFKNEEFVVNNQNINMILFIIIDKSLNMIYTYHFVLFDYHDNSIHNQLYSFNKLLFCFYH